MVKPRSRCPKCGHQLPWYENIPVLSWVALRGRCSGCKAPISPRYVLVELLTGTLYVAALSHFGWTLQLVGALTFLSLLIPLIFIDAEHWVLPFELTVPGIVLGLALRAPLGWDVLRDGLVGAVAGFMLFRALEFLGWLAVGREAMGGGDKFLVAMAGATLGWQGLFGVVFLSALQGAVFGITKMVVTGRAGPGEEGDDGNATDEVPVADRRAALMAHLGAVVSSVVAPLLVTYTAGRRSLWVREQAIEALNFQLTFLVLLLLPLGLLRSLGEGAEAAAPSLWMFEGVLVLSWLGLTVLGSLRVWAGVRYLYPMTVRLVPSPELPGDESDEDAAVREPFTPACFDSKLPLWTRLTLVPYTLFWQDIPDAPPADEETGEEPEWVPGASNLPFGPWIGLAAMEVLLLGPWLAELCAPTPFAMAARVLLGQF